MNVWRTLTIAGLAVALLTATGVLLTPTPRRSSPTYAVASPPHAPARPTRVTKRPANILGKVFVLMYHRTGPTEKYMVRSYEHFRKDLLAVYKMGWRPVTMAEYVSNKMNLAPGATPVVFTFDDSHPTQFSLLPNGQVDPHCFVGMWLKFAASHPDFPVKATFYINDNGPWGSHKTAAKKLALLKKWGCELGGHTLTHPNLAKLSDDKVRHEMAGIYEYIEERGFTVKSFALPYGIFPRNRTLIHGLKWNHRVYLYQSNVMAGDSPNVAPTDPQFNPFKIYRIQACPQITGIDWWINRVKLGRVKVYVSP